jgi:hypothetical protein
MVYGYVRDNNKFFMVGSRYGYGVRTKDIVARADLPRDAEVLHG